MSKRSCISTQLGFVNGLGAYHERSSSLRFAQADTINMGRRVIHLPLSLSRMQVAVSASVEMHQTIENLTTGSALEFGAFQGKLLRIRK